MVGWIVAGVTDVIDYTYDLDGQLATMAHNGRVISYDYTKRHQIKNLRLGTQVLAGYGYDLAGRLTSISRPNGVGTILAYVNVARDLTSVTHGVGSTVLDSVTYGLNIGNSRREAATRAGTAVSSLGWNDAYSYDSAGQVIGADYAVTAAGSAARTESFEYDYAGNRTAHHENSSTGPNTTLYTSNNLDEYTQIGDAAQAYDANGNMTSLVPPAPNAATITMKWDGENRFVGASVPGVGVKQQFDALHRRIAKEIYNEAGVLTKRITFIYDGWNVIEERHYTAGNALTARFRYTWGRDLSDSLQGAGGVGGLLMAEEIATGNGSVTAAHYYHHDGNGNVIALTNSQGQTEGLYHYTAFGGNAGVSASSNTAFAATQPYRFSTKYLDREVETVEGMYYYGYRTYSPVVGRWLSRDPIGERGGRNLYGMVGNDTIDTYDFLGLEDGIDTKVPCKKAGEIADPNVERYELNSKIMHDAQDATKALEEARKAADEMAKTSSRRKFILKLAGKLIPLPKEPWSGYDGKMSKIADEANAELAEALEEGYKEMGNSIEVDLYVTVSYKECCCGTWHSKRTTIKPPGYNFKRPEEAKKNIIKIMDDFNDKMEKNPGNYIPKECKL